MHEIGVLKRRNILNGRQCLDPSQDDESVVREMLILVDKWFAKKSNDETAKLAPTEY